LHGEEGYFIIFTMAVSPEDLAAGALALQVFVKNAKNVEIIVNVAFGAIPSILGIGAAGLLGSGIINTAREVRNSISLLKTVGPMAQLGWMAGKGLGKGVDKVRKGIAERLQQSDNERLQKIGNFLLKKKNQDTQGKQEEQSGGGSGGTPPTPPNTKADKKEEKEEIKNVPIHPSHDIPNPLKKKK
jgi:hypothetical protein